VRGTAFLSSSPTAYQLAPSDNQDLFYSTEQQHTNSVKRPSAAYDAL